MKKIMFFILVICFLLAGCSSAEDKPEAEITPKIQESVEEMPGVDLSSAAIVNQEVSVTTIYPLPDATMENLNDAILSISLEEGDVYVDDTGKMQMDIKIYSYDKYDMVDISVLKAGDILVTHAGEVEILSIERLPDGSIAVNGGVSENGFELVTDEHGVFYERGLNNVKNWHEIGEATIRVSVDFICHDNFDPEQGEIIYYPESFLVGEVTNYDFTPYNTTIRVENGQVIEMHRIYIS